MFCSCLARMSSPPTPTSSSGSPVDVARERAPIALPGCRQIRRGNPDDGAPRPSRRRLRHLGHPPPRSPALWRLLRRPRLSCPPRQAHRRHAAPPPRQRRRQLTARRPEEESLRLFPNVERSYCYGKSPSYRVLVGLFLCRRLSSVTETNTRIELRLNIFSI